MKKNTYGFTIVELLIVIVVIGILAAISIVAYNGISNKANDASTKSDLSNLERKLKSYHAANSKFPDSIEEMMDDGFAATEKMGVGDLSTPRGEYLVLSRNYNNGDGSLEITYWDYEVGTWMHQSFVYYGGSQKWEFFEPHHNQLYAPGSNTPGCTTQYLSDCERVFY